MFYLFKDPELPKPYMYYYDQEILYFHTAQEAFDHHNHFNSGEILNVNIQ